MDETDPQDGMTLTAKKGGSVHSPPAITVRRIPAGEARSLPLISPPLQPMLEQVVHTSNSLAKRRCNSVPCQANFKLSCDNAGSCGSTTFQGTTYKFDHIHLHARSEHTIATRYYPLELHFVHQSPCGALLVVSRLFRRGAANPSLQRVFDIARGKSSGMVNLRRLAAPAISKVAVYVGSLTTPPCTEGVTFSVSPVIATASSEQIAQFRELIGGGKNNRPIQPLNSRTVTLYEWFVFFIEFGTNVKIGDVVARQ